MASSHSDASLVRESPTTSNALDRIAKRAVSLDNVYRHTGTGRGVTVYVFDGGVSMTHPELAGRVRIGFSEYPDGPANLQRARDSRRWRDRRYDPWRRA